MRLCEYFELTFALREPSCFLHSTQSIPYISRLGRCKEGDTSHRLRCVATVSPALFRPLVTIFSRASGTILKLQRSPGAWLPLLPFPPFPTQQSDLALPCQKTASEIPFWADAMASSRSLTQSHPEVGANLQRPTMPPSTFLSRLSPARLGLESNLRLT